ncbi:ABC transporter substrate-binding protein [Mesorhizobium sp. KR9-304]|uniref:ABC transporter substrate-binding protein n=1 Tax=Mesorhizobium sp. KR9-304 TaxID=3156614 RepID=UPI0032B3B7AA
MSTIALKGLGWGHRRATGPLAPLSSRFSLLHPHVSIDWTIRPLTAFEDQPLSEVARAFDLLIVDHPFSGQIVEEALFVPLDQHLPRCLGSGADALYCGPSLRSYRRSNALWVAPIDAACVHSAARMDLLDRLGYSMPSTLNELLQLGRHASGRIVMPLASPHAFTTAASLMANLGHPIAEDAAGFAYEPTVLSEMLDVMDEVFSFCDPRSCELNSIGVHDAMVQSDQYAFCPWVFGYATYAENNIVSRLSFGSFFGPNEGHAGSMLGGAGLGVSAFSAHPSEALSFVEFAMSEEAQGTIIPAHHGQPALTKAWDDAHLDQQYGGYFSSTRASLERAWIRPTSAQYPTFQSRAGAIFEHYFRRNITRAELLSRFQSAASSPENPANRKNSHEQ